MKFDIDIERIEERLFIVLFLWLFATVLIGFGMKVTCLSILQNTIDQMEEDIKIKEDEALKLEFVAVLGGATAEAMTEGVNHRQPHQTDNRISILTH